LADCHPRGRNRVWQVVSMRSVFKSRSNIIVRLLTQRSPMILKILSHGGVVASYCAAWRGRKEAEGTRVRLSSNGRKGTCVNINRCRVVWFILIVIKDDSLVIGLLCTYFYHDRSSLRPYFLPTTRLRTVREFPFPHHHQYNVYIFQYA
jgi:hypothetical protein